MSTRISFRARRLVLGGAILGLAAGTVGAAVAGDWGPQFNPHASTAVGEPNTFAPYVNSPGPGLPPDQAIAQVTDALNQFGVISASRIDPPDGTAGTPWLSVQVDSDLADDVLPDWLALLTEGAVADLMHTDEATTHDVIGGTELVDTDKSGQQLATPLGYGAVVAGQDFRSPSDAELADRVSQVAAQFGLGVSSVQVLHPLDSALEVTLTVPEGDVNWTINQLQDSLQGDPRSIEGIYIELDSEAGDPLLRTSEAGRSGGGSLWFAPGQDERFGALHFGPAPDPRKHGSSADSTNR